MMLRFQVRLFKDIARDCCYSAGMAVENLFWVFAIKAAILGAYSEVAERRKKTLLSPLDSEGGAEHAPDIGPLPKRIASLKE
jgi:hypothetical protein